MARAGGAAESSRWEVEAQELTPGNDGLGSAVRRGRRYIPAMAVMSLSFENSATAHDDLVLRLDQFERRCDSYYLALDNLLLSEEHGADKVTTRARPALGTMA